MTDGQMNTQSVDNDEWVNSQTDGGTMGEQHVPLWHLRRKFQIVSGCLPDSLSPLAVGKSRGERLRGTDQEALDPHLLPTRMSPRLLP